MTSSAVVIGCAAQAEKSRDGPRDAPREVFDEPRDHVTRNVTFHVTCFMIRAMTPAVSWLDASCILTSFPIAVGIDIICCYKSSLVKHVVENDS